MGLNVVILAAGQGTRMVTNLPKVAHKIGGLAMLERVVMAASELKPDAIHVVYGAGGDTLKNLFHYLPVNWVHQAEQLGTGHAVLQAMPFCDPKNDVIILYGDVPLISTATLNRLRTETPQQSVGVVVTEMENPTGFGRIIRDKMGNVTAIVEEKDATPAQKGIHEINTGIMAASAKALKTWLPALKNTNAQHEFYLTDIVSMAVANGHAVSGVLTACHQEVSGVNNRKQLAELERYYQKTLAEDLLLAGVTIMDPARFDARTPTLNIQKDVLIDINVVMEGEVSIGSHSVIGPNVYLKDVTIGEHVEIKANSVVEGASIADNATVGPFARVRPGAKIKRQAKLGNFVEIKNATLGEGSKVSHLSYIGDSEIGKNVNIGAGTITCNYDGKNKHKTVIEDDVFVGSNTAIIAPAKLQKGATIAAGSTITQDVPENSLAIARAHQENKKGWTRE